MNYTGMYGRNKCNTITTKNGIYLKSYDTIVMGIVNGKLKRFWGGYSKITMAHIGCFITEYNIDAMLKGKKQIEWAGRKTWDDMKVYSCGLKKVA